MLILLVADDDAELLISCDWLEIAWEVDGNCDAGVLVPTTGDEVAPEYCAGVLEGLGAWFELGAAREELLMTPALVYCGGEMDVRLTALDDCAPWELAWPALDNIETVEVDWYCISTDDEVVGTANVDDDV